jgi:RNA polymerase sigma factor (sigma-70 family)
MAHGHLGQVFDHLRRLLGAPCDPDQADGQLLERFVRQRDQDAFQALLQRHGPMVLGVCRRVLRDLHAADDAFQATFLVLLRRAAALDRTRPLGGWLHGVAYRVAMRAKANACKRSASERPAEDLETPDADPSTRMAQREVDAVLDEELCRLPAKYRETLILCYLQGKTNEQAAVQLGWPAGSMSRHLTRARELLHDRLVRRGVTVSAGLLGPALAREASAAAPAEWLAATGARLLCGAVPEHVSMLAEGVLRAMHLTRLKIAAAVLLTAGLISSGVAAHQVPAAKPPAEPRENQRAAGTPAVEAVKRENLRLPHQGLVAGVSFSPDGRLLATAAAFGRVHIWNAVTGKPVRVCTTDKIEEMARRWEGPLLEQSLCRRVTFVPGGKYLVSWALRSKEVQLWQIDNGKQRRTWNPAPEQLNSFVASVAVSPDGKLLACGTTDTTVCLWKTDSGQEVRRFRVPNRGKAEFGNARIFSLAFSPDGKLLATGCAAFVEKRNGVFLPVKDTRIILWDLATGKELRTCEWRDSLIEHASIVFSPDGQLVAAGCNQKIGLWEVATGSHVLSWQAHPSKVQSLVFTPDGRFVASLDEKAEICLWEVTGGPAVASWEGFGSVAFSPDGASAAWGSKDGTVQVRSVSGLEIKEVPRPAELSAKDLEALWADLAGNDAPRAHQAIHRLALTPSQVEAFLKTRLPPATPAEPGRLKQLVADLESPQFAVRQKATAELEKLGELAITALRRALAGKPSLEVQQRVQTLLTAAENVAATPERLRSHRAVLALVRRPTPEARQILETLARGAEGVSVTEQAKAALVRLARLRSGMR